MEHRTKTVRKRNKIFTQNQNYILELDLNYPGELHERDDDYPMAPELMNIEAEITGEKKHALRAQYIGAACQFTR